MSPYSGPDPGRFRGKWRIPGHLAQPEELRSHHLQGPFARQSNHARLALSRA